MFFFSMINACKPGRIRLRITPGWRWLVNSKKLFLFRVFPGCCMIVKCWKFLIAHVFPMFSSFLKTRDSQVLIIMKRHSTVVILLFPQESSVMFVCTMVLPCKTFSMEVSPKRLSSSCQWMATQINWMVRRLESCDLAICKKTGQL